MARAQRLLAMRYLRGRGVPKDEAIAFYWMQLAAQQHFAMAQRSLGELYKNGSGIALDITIASHWYGLAALQGDSIAKKHLQRLAQPKTLCKNSSQSTQQGPHDTHPEGGPHSGIDRKTLRKIAEDAGGLPAISLVWTPAGFLCAVDRW